MADRIDGILAALNELRHRDEAHHTFGSEKHEYRFGPALMAADVSAIEQHYRIRLPAEYGEFLVRAGNGGAGPGYGLERLGWVESTQALPKAARQGELVTVVRTPRMTLQRPRLYDERDREIDPFDVSYYDLMKVLADEADPTAPSRPFPLTGPAETVADELDVHAGSLLLANYGCAIEGRIVLGGAFAGHMWVFDGSYGSYMPFAHYAELHLAGDDAEIDRGRPFTFLDWYEHWLNAALAERLDR